MAFVFPAHLFSPTEVNARIVQSTMSGGVALSGDEDVVATDGGGRWQIDFAGIELRTPAQQRAWSAWIGHLGGGSIECLVPLLSLVTAPRPYSGMKIPARPPQLAYDDELFPTTVGYSAPYIEAEVVAAAALRATSLQITVTTGGEIKGGEKFSIGERAHRIIRETASGTFQIEPPLRGEVEIAAPVNFDWPVVKCRMMPGEDFEGAISRSRFGSKHISFIESFSA